MKNLDKDELLKKVGWEKDGGWYWETVYRTNTMSAFNAGRAEAFEQYKPEFLEFIGIEDSRQTTQCAERSGVIKKRTDPFWKSSFPPLHYNCRSTVRPVYAEEAAAFGIKESADVSFPDAPAKGFGHNPAENWDGVTEEVKRRYERQKAAAEKPASADGYVDALKTYPFFKSVPKELKADFENDLLKVKPEQLSFLVKHAKTMKGKLDYTRGIPHYDDWSKKIFLNLKREDERSLVSGYSTDVVAFLHESGHWLDYNRKGGSIHDNLPKLKELIQKDALNYVNQILGSSGKIESFETLDKSREVDGLYVKILEYEIAKKSAVRNGVSDLINDASDGKIDGEYSHNENYWQQKGALEEEAIAHFFAARGSGGERLKETKKAFPTAYKYFDDFVRGVT